MNYQRLNYPNGYKKIVQPKQGCKMPPQPNIPMPIPEPMPMPKPMPLPTPVPNNNPPLNLFPVDEGYVKGTIFRGLYQPYKNMSPIAPVNNTKMQRMLFDVNKYHFAMTELSFYLNNFPNDVEALRLFNGFRKDYLRAKNEFETEFGALDMTSQQLERGPWNWVQTTAPWKRGV
ncbi:MAG: spore coat protein CotJB [Bacilli bacterium]|nr:spore coat protein CotJB [Bacilli bacterium]